MDEQDRKTLNIPAPGAPHPDAVARAIAAPPTLGNAPLTRTEPFGKLDPFGPEKAKLGVGLAGSDPLPLPGQSAATGRDASGTITADSAQAAMAAPMQRPGGIFGSYDGKGVNDILARENKARGEMIDLMVKADGGNGINMLPDRTDEANSQGMSIGDIQSAMKSAGTRTERAAYGQMLGTALNNQTQQRGQDLRHAADMAVVENSRLRGDDRLDVLRRGQDLRAETAAERNAIAAQRIASNEALGLERIAERAGRTDKPQAPTLAQERGNAEIDASRARIAGLTPEEIKRKTANFTATGRENPDFDPTLAKAAALANRRKVGADDEFDARQQAQQPGKPAFTREEVNSVIARGADRARVAERIKSLGGNPADYGL